MKGKFILLALLLSTFWVGSQAQQNHYRNDYRLEPQGDNQCLTSTGHVKACRGNQVTYRVFSPSAYMVTDYTWHVTGGTIVSQNVINYHSATCTVEWGDGDEGLIEVTPFPEWDCNLFLQVDLVDKPVIGLISSPSYVLPDPGDPKFKMIEVCDGETITLTDNSSIEDNSIAGYYWESPYGTSNSRTYSFTASGPDSYNIIHRVYNKCGCYDEEEIKVVVGEGCPVKLSCFGAVCAHTEATYTVEEPAFHRYYWTVENGTLMDPKEDRTVTVLWGAPASGFGTLTLVGEGSDCACQSRKSFQVPVISDNVPISGPDVICVSEQAEFSLPLWGATEYNWSSSSMYMNATPTTPYSNVVNVTATQPGTYTLTAMVNSEFLKCGPLYITKTIVVKPELGINPIPEQVCVGDVADLFSNNPYGVMCHWTIMKNNQVVYTEDTEHTKYEFEESGVYVIYAESDDYCKRVSTIVTVNRLPRKPVIDGVNEGYINGPHVVCPNSSAYYYAHYGLDRSPDEFYIWNWTSDNQSYSYGGDHVDIDFGNTFNGLNVYALDRVTGCRSESVVYQVSPLQLAPWPYSNNVSMCRGQQITLDDLMDQSANGVIYEWSVNPTNAISIQGSNRNASVTLLANYLNNPQTYVTVSLKRTYCGVEQTNSVTVRLGQIDAPEIGHGALCTTRSNHFYISNPNDASEDSTYWYVDNNLNERVYGTSVYLNVPSNQNNSNNSTHVLGPEQHVVYLHYETEGGCSVLTQSTFTFQYCPPLEAPIDFCNRVTGAFGVVQHCYNSISINNLTGPGLSYNNLTISVYKDGRLICGPTAVTSATQKIIVPEAGTCMIKAEWAYNDNCYHSTAQVTINNHPQVSITNACNGNIIVSAPYNTKVSVAGQLKTITSRILRFVTFSSIPTGDHNVHFEFPGGNCCFDTNIYIYSTSPVIDLNIGDMCVNNALVFSANVEGYAPFKYEWDFGDGSSNKGNNIEHVYNVSGTKTVTLTVKDASGCATTETTTVQILPYDGNQFSNITQSYYGGADACEGTVTVLTANQGAREYEWYNNAGRDQNNHYIAYANVSGAFTLDITTQNYCHKQIWGNVSRPTNLYYPNWYGVISSKSTYCMGETVEVIGDKGPNFEYTWIITRNGGTPETITGQRNLTYVPSQAGTYTVSLTVSDPLSGCTFFPTATTSFYVCPLFTGPVLNLNNPACLSDGPVTVSVTNNPFDSYHVLWSNGSTGNTTQYYTGGLVEAYFIHPSFGCPSQKTSIVIPEAPNFDGFLSGCYRVCPRQYTGDVPLYNLGDGAFSYDMYHNGRYKYSGSLPPVPDYLPVHDDGDYQLVVNYGAGCTTESPLLSIQFDEEACQAIRFDNIHVECKPEDGCVLNYVIYARVWNNTPDPVNIMDVIPSTSSIVNFHPFVVNPGGYEDIIFIMRYDPTTPSGIQFNFIDDRGENAGILGIDLTEWTDCFHDCGYPAQTLLEPVYYEPTQSIFFRFKIDLPVGDIVSVWGDQSEIYFPNYSGGPNFDGLLVLDYGLTSQRVANDEKFCFHVLVCNGGKLCITEVCIPYKEIWDAAQTGNPMHYANEERTELKPVQQTFSLVPNPATSIVNVHDSQIDVPADNIISIEVLSMQGQKVLSVEGTSQFDVSSLPAGAYIVRVVTDTNQHEYLKLIKR